MTEGTQRRLTTIVATDILGFSRLFGVDEKVLAAECGHRSELTEALHAEIHGCVANMANDSLLQEFLTAIDAVQKIRREKF